MTFNANPCSIGEFGSNGSVVVCQFSLIKGVWLGQIILSNTKVKKISAQLDSLDDLEIFATINPIRDKGKLAAAFGSYGWSGEAVRRWKKEWILLLMIRKL